FRRPANDRSHERVQPDHSWQIGLKNVAIVHAPPKNVPSAQVVVGRVNPKRHANEQGQADHERAQQAEPTENFRDSSQRDSHISFFSKNVAIDKNSLSPLAASPTPGNLDGPDAASGELP